MTNSRARLLALVEEAARDPSGARSLLEEAAGLVDRELRTVDAPPEGYVYAGAHTLVARFDTLEVEELPDPDNPQIRPLTATVNQPTQIVVPFNCLIEGVSGWATPRVPSGLDSTEINGMLEMGVCPDGRDLFATMWSTDGNRAYTTDGRFERLEPAAVVVGTRRNPRPLAWRLTRGTLINVYARNLTNALNPSGFREAGDIGWDLAVSVQFHLVNLERP